MIAGSLRRAAASSVRRCLDYEAASLEPRKIYVALRDAAAERNGLLRVVDESGEDYLYSRERFAPLKLPRGLQHSLAAAE